MANFQFITAFLSTVEGPCKTTAYIPCKKKAGGTANYTGKTNPDLYTAMGASGVTIATGCDLGQTDAATLLRYGLAKDIIQLYTPYFGLRKAAALSRLHAAPLSIGRPEAEATDRAVHNGYLHCYTIPAWEKASGKSFDDLPNEAQAVIMSVTFQKGCGGVRRDWPKTWQALVACDWKAASLELMHGFREYVGRRQAEGRLLQNLF